MVCHLIQHGDEPAHATYVHVQAQMTPLWWNDPDFNEVKTRVLHSIATLKHVADQTVRDALTGRPGWTLEVLPVEFDQGLPPPPGQTPGRPHLATTPPAAGPVVSSALRYPDPSQAA